jgi:hypothetical protein
VDIKKTSDSTIKIDGAPADGIDHNREYIYLWIAPEISLSLTSVSAAWSFSGTGTALIQYVQAGWVSDSCLKNQKQPGCMPEPVQTTFKNAGFTNDDFKEIRTHDVLLDNGKLDPERFVPLNHSYPYEPPSSATDPVPTYTDRLTDASSTTTGVKVSYDYKVETTLSGSANFVDVVKVSMKSTYTWE